MYLYVFIYLFIIIIIIIIYVTLVCPLIHLVYSIHNQIKSNQKVLFKVGTFYNNQHKLSRAFQTDMHNKLHKLNTAQ